MTARGSTAAGARPVWLLSVAITTLFLAACHTVPKTLAPAAVQGTVAADWPARRAQLQSRPQFTTQGRIGVVAGSDGFSGHLRWAQDGARSTMSLDGPLGVGGVRITEEAGALTMTTPSGQALDSEAAHDEVVRRLGFEPPLSSLRYWIQGIPDPADAGTETPNDGGPLSSLVQSGWTVTFGSYLQTADGALPQKVTIERDAIRVKLVLDAWHTP